MRPLPANARVVVPRNQATIEVAARAALEMTESCYVWLERIPQGLAVSMELRHPADGEIDLEARFAEHLQRIARLAAHQRRTRALRSAIIARALGPRPKPAPQPALPPLDPETEAEIEKLLAEIESDDWLDDAGEIAQTWEERFGKGSPGDDQGGEV